MDFYYCIYLVWNSSVATVVVTFFDEKVNNNYGGVDWWYLYWSYGCKKNIG